VRPGAEKAAQGVLSHPKDPGVACRPEQAAELSPALPQLRVAHTERRTREVKATEIDPGKAANLVDAARALGWTRPNLSIQ